MDKKYLLDTMDRSTFNDLLKQYPDVVPEKLAELEQQRLKTIPEAVQARDPPYLTKDELATLMDWKLAHGTFRPSLKKLIQQNDEDFVRSQTEIGFSLTNNANDAEPQSPTAALDALCKLRGVGPATASLILSTYKARQSPFLSDELYRWVFFDSPADGKGGKGWGRQIKYTAKEWVALRDALNEFRPRLVSASGKGFSPPGLDYEKVAYVLVKRAQDGGSGATKAGGTKRKAAVAEAIEGKQQTTDTKDESHAEPTSNGRVTRSSKRNKPS